MGLFGSIKSLFGGSSTEERRAAADPVEYNGFQIEPTPAQKDGGWNTAGVIRKSVDGEIKEQSFIRVDTHSSLDDAIAFSVTKAQQIIDEQGDNLFRARR